MARYQATGRLVPTLLGVLGVFFWGAETALITYTTRIPPLQTVAIAFVFAALLAPVAWVLDGRDPWAAFRQPTKIWVLTVGSLAGYHSCIYYATQKAPPAAAALLQGTTPLMIVLGSALLPGERLRWWHLVGVSCGLCGVLLLIQVGSDAQASRADSAFYLSLVGLAAGLWGFYSVLSRRLPEVPTSALGTFYAAAAILLGLLHVLLEDWVAPSATEWLALAGLGIVPMGAAIYLWDYGLKKGDIQALGSMSYLEPFVGAALVGLLTGEALEWGVLWSGALVLSGAVFGSVSLWRPQRWLDGETSRGLSHRCGRPMLVAARAAVSGAAWMPRS